MDAPTRVIHWLLALSFLGAYLTADGERWRLVHVTLGYTMAGLLAARVLWGVAGPRPARLSAWGRRLQGLPAWVRSAVAGRMDGRQAENLALAASVALLLAWIAPLTLTGLATFQEWTAGEWLEEVHEFFGNGLLVLVLTHIGIVLGLSLRRRRNLIAPMITGRAPGAGPDLVRRGFTSVAALVVLAVLAFWTWTAWQAPSGGGQAQAQSHRHHHHDDDD